ncbi:MAG TPA: hypothetical protein VNK06_04365 [Thermodesulfobacteriota bacterium]|nr:hypothetical protein [Thermodesulfobacteriota bacterium]
MIRLFFGGVAGVVLLGLFFYLGGPRYLTALGAKTEQTGEKLEKYEKEIKDSAEKTVKTVKKKTRAAKETVDETIEKAKEKIDGFMK